MEQLLRETTSPVGFLFNLNLITGITNTFANTCTGIILIKRSQNCGVKIFSEKINLFFERCNFYFWPAR